MAVGERWDRPLAKRKQKNSVQQSRGWSGRSRCSISIEGSIIGVGKADDGELEEIEGGRPYSGWWKASRVAIPWTVCGGGEVKITDADWG